MTGQPDHNYCTRIIGITLPGVIEDVHLNPDSFRDNFNQLKKLSVDNIFWI